MRDDSWKGEHFIRAPKKVAEYEYEVELERGPRPREKTLGKPLDICSVPLCGKGLSYRNSSGVCLQHKHHVRYCTCIICRDRRAKRT